MADQMTRLMLKLDAGPDANAEELENLTQQLREELMHLHVETVDLVSGGETPAKSKAGGPITWGTLLLTLAASGGVLTTMINLLRSWLNRSACRKLILEIDSDRLEVTGISSQNQQQLIECWLRRHSGVRD